MASLDQLILLVHSHGQQCPLTPRMQSDPCRQEVKAGLSEEDPDTLIRSSKAPGAELCPTYVCEGGHVFAWRPMHTHSGDGGMSEERRDAPSGQRKNRERQKTGVKREKTMRSRRRARRKSVSDLNLVSRRSASGENDVAGNPHDIQ